jgi:hypothetical protein
MNEPLDPSLIHARLRSGTAARLAGVPVATLRVWERRYGVVAAPKTETGQRLYSGLDVQRLRLLRQLTEAGHAIGSLATLEPAALQALAGATPPDARAPRAPQVAPAATRRVLLVGRGLAPRLKAMPGLALLATLDELAAAEDMSAADVEAAAGADTLLLHCPSLQPGDGERVAALRRRWPAAEVLLLYAFGAEAVLESLRVQGVTLRREPLGARELARLLAPRPPAPAGAAAVTTPAPRRYNDATLAALADLPSDVVCECPRHLAEIVLQLVGFERYSADCLARSPADAALHQRLCNLAGTARALFEQAVADVVAAEGLVLPDAG